MGQLHRAVQQMYLMKWRVSVGKNDESEETSLPVFCSAEKSLLQIFGTFYKIWKEIQLDPLFDLHLKEHKSLFF